MKDSKVKWLDSVASTHTLLAKNPDDFDFGEMVCAREQLAGRGQRGNGWESESGKNISASIKWLAAGVAPSRQFFISEAVALGVCDLLAEEGIEAMVKWPNDIYVADKKIAGILIEHSLLGNKFSHTILSIGLNVNQRKFLSDAPNPVSMWQLDAKERELEELAPRLWQKIRNRLENIGDGKALHDDFLSKLYRGDGRMYPFHDNLRDESISASIAGVAPDGTLTLDLSTGEARSYLFKEVSFRV